MNVRPLGETSVSRVYFFRRQSSLCYSDALSGLLDFFSSLRLHTHRPPPSLQCVSSPPPPSSCPEHPECNSSLCLHCFRALPSSAHQTAELPDCLTACPALDSFTQSGNARATAPLPSCQTATPLSGQDVTQRRL